MNTDEDRTQTPDGQLLADVWFLNVGQGDCTFAIDHRTRSAILIDCPSGSVKALVGVAQRENAVLDTAIVTHWDLDHYGGIARAAAALSARQVLYNHDTFFPDAESPPFAIRSTLLQFLDLRQGQTVLDSA